MRMMSETVSSYATLTRPMVSSYGHKDDLCAPPTKMAARLILGDSGSMNGNEYTVAQLIDYPNN